MVLEQFGPYLLLEKIDKGGMAEIFLAEDTSQKKTELIVIKRMLNKDLDSQRALELFMHEAKLNMNMNHPNVVKFMDFGSIEDRFFIAMEYIEGLNLQQILRQIRELKLEPFAVNDAVHVIIKASEGVFHAHNLKDENTNRSMNIIHKDLSTDNIMVDIKGNIKVIDFGVSESNDTKVTQNNDGKCPYMSPEQALGEALDQRSDIFSLGAVLWELLSGSRLYNGKTIDEIKSMAKQAKIKSLKTLRPELPQKLIDIIDKALEKNKKNRFTDMGAFKNELILFLDEYSPSYTNENLAALVDLCHESHNEKAQKPKAV